VSEDPAFVPTWLAIAEWASRSRDRPKEVSAPRRVVELTPDLGDLAKRLREIGE
jgi:hypothetical protein